MAIEDLMDARQKRALRLLVAQLIDYIQRLNDIKLYTYQRYEISKILKAIISGSGVELTELWARQIGKTEAGLQAVLICMVCLPMMAQNKELSSMFPQLTFYRNGFRAGFVAPHARLASIPFNRLRTAIRRTDIKGTLLQMGIAIEACNSIALALSNGSTALAMSGAETSFNEGESFHYLHFDETQEISQYKIYKSFHPMLASTGGCSVKVGTPSLIRSAFYDTIQFNKREAPENHGEYPWQYGARENPAYKRFVENQIARLGEDSEVIKMAYCLEWTSLSTSLFDLVTWKKMAGDGVDGHPRFMQGIFSQERDKVYGLDWGKAHDATVLTMGEDWGDHLRIIDWLYLRGVPYEEQLESIFAVIDSIGKGHIVSDSTGVGDPITERVTAKYGDDYVTPLNFSLKNKDILAKTIKNEATSGRLFYPGIIQDPKVFRRFEKECLECELEVKGNLMTFHHPYDGDNDKHDDFPDSAANFVYGGVNGAKKHSTYGGCRY